MIEMKNFLLFAQTAFFVGLSLGLHQVNSSAQTELPCFAVFSSGQTTDLTHMCGSNNEQNANIISEQNASAVPAHEQVLQQSVSLAEEGNYQEAISESTRSISLDPNYADAYAIRGNLLRRSGDYQAAYRDYRQAADLFEEQGDSVLAETFRRMAGDY